MHDAHSYHSPLAAVQRGIKFTAVFSVIVVLLLAGSLSTSSQAATLVPDDLDDAGTQTLTPDPAQTHTQILIRRIQTALETLGLYEGPVNGTLTEETGQAIRRYQKSKRLPETGIADEALAQDLETAVNVNALLQRLAVARENQTREAREALLANPATRDLIEHNAADAVADPTRDPAQCFATPTVRCLLAEALENAKAIPRDNMRNWAYSDILVPQARAGLSDAARNTIRHISDPRMILSALGEIAQSQSHAGDMESAMAAVLAIPDADVRMETYASMASITANRGNKDGTLDIIGHMRAYSDDLPLTTKLSASLARGSAALFQAGETDAALALLDEVRTRAEDLTIPVEQRDIVLRHVADALAIAGFTEQAIAMLESIRNPDERMPVLMSAARHEAESGDPDTALAMAETIEAVRYRPLVMVSIAQGQAEKGLLEDARNTLSRAVQVMEMIDLPFARDYATSRVAIGYAAIASASEPPNASLFQLASRYADSISDDRLSAYSTWQVLFASHDNSDSITRFDIDIAMRATERIQAPSGRVWLLAELAEERADLGDEVMAWSIFDRAMEISMATKNAWGRSRSLSRLSLSLIRLAENGLSR